MNFCFRDIFGFNDGLIKPTSDIACVSEVRSKRNDSSASSNRSFSWLSIEKVRRSVIVEDRIIVSVLLVVQRDLNDRLTQDVRGRRVDSDSS